MNALRSVTALFLLAVACGPISHNPIWEKCGGGTVAVSVSAITLGDQCGSSSAALRAGDCAPSFAGGCGSICRSSSVQLDVVSTSHSPARLEVREVRLYDPDSGALVDTLSASEAKQWLNNSYQAWDESVGAGATVKASYRLSAPQWSKIDAAGGRINYSKGYQTQVDVAVDGELRTLAGPDAFREPEVAT
jgi:hypothetical protein